MSSSFLYRFANDERGNTAMIFALTLIPVVFAAGAALDYTRADNLRTRLQAATDGTLLNLCQASTSLTQDQLNQKALRSVQGYIPDADVGIDPVIVTNSPRSVTLTARATYQTTFARISGVESMDLSVRGSCSAEERFFEIALAVDTTGSMNASSGGTSKIAALRQASSNFVDYVFTNGSLANHTKVSLVPFSAAVAVDPGAYKSAAFVDLDAKSSYHRKNINGAAASGFSNRFGLFTKLRSSVLSWDWAGCFEALPYPLNVKDGKPTASDPDSYYVPMFAPDEAGDGGSPSHTEASSNKTQVTPNSYIADKNLVPGCTTNPPDDPTRMTRACKYVSPTSASSASARGPNYMCRSRPLTRLTSDRSKLLAEIGALTADGNTNIHEGALWGWRTLSPQSVFADGVPYTQRNTTKVLVLMTDGENTWGANGGNSILKSVYSAYSYWRNADGSTPNGRLPDANANPSTEAQARAAMDALTRETCKNASEAGVVIYTIGFSIASDPIDAQGLKLLSDCAGASDRAFVANDSAGLVSAFDKIARSIGSLRLTQ